jgi:uncharacterized protein
MALSGNLWEMLQEIMKFQFFCHGVNKMPIHIIPIDQLSTEALDGVIKEFISRNGTDYGEFEASAEKKFSQVKQKLEKGLAILIYDDEMETTNIFRSDDPILRKLDKLDE